MRILSPDMTTLISLIFFFLAGFTPGFSQPQTNPHGNIGIDCQACHVADSWTVLKNPMIFDHNSSTRYPLTGTHQSVACLSCHRSLNFSQINTDCKSCHEDIHRGTLGQSCEQCHETMVWGPLSHGNMLNIHQRSRFPLTGAHQTANCTSCHPKSSQGVMFKVSSVLDCFSCHHTDYKTAKNPDHQSLGFPVDCQQCHSPFAWTPSSFNHSLFSFPLTGTHAITDCNSCHQNSTYKGTPKDCFSCHKDVYQTAQHPNHVSGRLSTLCETCHTTISWEPSTFNHSSTRFPLTGAHVLPSCESCHVNGQFSGIATDCFSCHQTDYQSTLNPKHTPDEFPFNCQVCHSEVSWKPAAFDHNKTTFPLTGGHTTATCESCHSGGVYTGTPKDCAACHLKDSQSALNPRHSSAAFSTDCASCHTTFGWEPAQFNHSLTRFPLTGSHTSQTCESCHSGGNYTTIPSTDCYACHQADYQGTTNPKHSPTSFPFTCETCHQTTSWTPATFDHNKTAFPLTGGHTTADCASCHINGQYTGLATDCKSCHTPDYNKAVNHQTQGYPVKCETCHTNASWSPSSYNNHNGWFPIYSGKHKPSVWSSKCVTCHTVSTNFKVFVCTDCHEHNKTSMDKDHREVSGYVYNSANCYSCHPDGND
ncbi:MAG: hypothetical protein HUU10_12500 [Bacteroidetes bacterium]|nr:hypothetical protein [Bacteroidota bacterium]